MQSSRPLQFHIICDPAAADHLDTRFALFSRPAYDVNVTYYPITAEFAKARAERADVGDNYSLLTKVFMHELIDVEKSIYIDSDMIFVVDPLLLWDTFATFTSTTLVAFPTLGPRSHPGEVCSCVMLMHFARMRAAPLMPSSLLPTRTSVADGPFARGADDGIFDPHGAGIMDTDQGIYHILWAYRKDLFAHLSLRWDVSHCRRGYHMSLGRFGDADGEGMTEGEQIARQGEDGGAGEGLLIPGILHFNCQGDAYGNAWTYAENHNVNSFGPMVTVAQRYKWIWLNRGDGSARVRTTRKGPAEITWFDEREAASLRLRESVGEAAVDAVA
ncbi:hypothetical protein C8R44DRAFT_609271 [Mycena epipterygia]|nr:hypothetical protein C8R44DRAFT_609271 [Mycena epipterygia]